MDDSKKAKRVIDTFTGPWEKRNLPKMAVALPHWVTSDHLTLLGILAALMIAAGYILTWYSRWWLWMSNFGLLVHWYADSLDGTLARVRHREREKYGYFVDHICDAWAALVIFLGLGISPLMDMRVALFMTVSYYLLSIYVHIAAYTEGVFRISYARVGPTEMRIFICAVNIVLVFWNPMVAEVLGVPMTALDVGGVVVAILLIGNTIVCSIRSAIKLDRQDRAKWKEG